MAAINWNDPEKYLNSDDSSPFIFKGTLPLLLSVPHDGHLTEIKRGGLKIPLSKAAPDENRDSGVKYLAWQITRTLGDLTGRYPSLVIEQIHRQYINDKLRDKYYQNVLRMTNHLFGEYGEPPLALDLHGFSKKSGFMVFDMVFGTLHRRSVDKFNYPDVGLYYYLGLEGDYRIYLPNEIEFRGEMYTGDKKNGITVVKYLSDEFQAMGKPGNFIQIEIHKKFRGRSPEEMERGKLLAEHFARALINLFADLKMISARSAF